MSGSIPRTRGRAALLPSTGQDRAHPREDASPHRDEPHRSRRLLTLSAQTCRRALIRRAARSSRDRAVRLPARKAPNHPAWVRLATPPPASLTAAVPRPAGGPVSRPCSSPPSARDSIARWEATHGQQDRRSHTAGARHTRAAGALVRSGRRSRGRCHGDRRRARLEPLRGGVAAVPVRAEPDRRREAAIAVGGSAAAAPRPDEHHAGRGRGGEPADRPGLDGGHRGSAGRAERRAGRPAGAQSQGQRRRAVEDAGAAGEGAARRRGRPGCGVRTGSRRHRGSWRRGTSSRSTVGSSVRRRWRFRRRR